MTNVNNYARVMLNRKEVGAWSWQPYRWYVTKALRAGGNDLVIEVATTPEFRGFAGTAPLSAGITAAPEGTSVVPAGTRTSENPNPWPNTGILAAQNEAGPVAGPRASGLLGPVRLAVY